MTYEYYDFSDHGKQKMVTKDFSMNDRRRSHLQEFQHLWDAGDLGVIVKDFWGLVSMLASCWLNHVESWLQC